MEQNFVYSFTVVDEPVGSLSITEIKEQLLQYNLDKSLFVQKFRFTGNLSSSSTSDYDQLLKDFFCSSGCITALQATGSPSLPVELSAEALSVSVMNMEFFDKVVEAGLVGESGNIRGCYDEIFDGITASDQLREVLLNPDSEHASVFSETDRREFIYQLLRLFAVGGALCQPDTNFNRYLSITKAFYKDLVTIYKDSKTEQVKISGRVFRVSRVGGVELFPRNPTSPHNTLLLLVDPVKRTVIAVKNDFMPFW